MSKSKAPPRDDRKAAHPPAHSADRTAPTNDEDALDEALNETFPASDPIAIHSEHDDDKLKS
jgi:hypothetical protein